MIYWQVLILDAVILAAIVLIGTHYEWFWKIWMQFKEPFTRWIARFAEAHGYFYWTTQAIITLAAFSGLLLLPWYWRILDSYLFGFQVWFIPHIIQYILDHYPDNPPVGFRMFKQGLTVRQQTADDVWNMVVNGLPTGQVTIWDFIEAIDKVGKAVDAKYKI